MLQLLEKLGVNHEEEQKSVQECERNERMGKQQTIQLLKQLEDVTGQEQLGAKLLGIIEGNKGENATEGEEPHSMFFSNNSSNTEDSNENINTRKKKLTSRRCSKPDETDIQRVVRYAHEKLDPRHVDEREFDKLLFHILIVGELEITQHCEPKEKNA